jgi:hypothetical protein
MLIDGVVCSKDLNTFATLACVPKLAKESFVHRVFRLRLSRPFRRRSRRSNRTRRRLRGRVWRKGKSDRGGEHPRAFRKVPEPSSTGEAAVTRGKHQVFRFFFLAQHFLYFFSLFSSCCRLYQQITQQHNTTTKTGTTILETALPLFPFLSTFHFTNYPL